ncbi:DeoR/GlpR family DNA-binding transcription regulator [Enterococcus avium]|uniref:DeoR/GlpR family DNA-binding transcription regulator n=1 Tax=Enterococcus avium TaxID=33945 RepID=UPI00159D584E|nr:DeoR/GlpR family DNA-binding transcription regulator [Enterococcus avium]NVN77057.1 DeoR family transcriptional regulator [Enterococcus avium]
MLKTERQRSILAMCDRYGTITVKFIQEVLNVSDMTIRRDLEELAQKKKLLRVHGGAQKIDYLEMSTSIEANELSHTEKKKLHTKEKEYIAKNAAAHINQEDDTIFLGSGTTIELMTRYIKPSSLRIVTNSLPVFNLLSEIKRFELYLIGGLYREKTGAFVGSIANEAVQKIGIKKAFVGVNGLKGSEVLNFSIEEGTLQKIVLDNAAEKCLVSDANKFDHSDFYNFYDLRKIDKLFTDSTLSAELKSYYQQFTKIIQ